jgi:hypothetical protein
MSLFRLTSGIFVGCLLLSGIEAALPLSASSQASAETTPGTPIPFLNWLRGGNQDESEDPNIKRGDEFCITSFPEDRVTPIWSDRPVFLVQGAPRSLAVYAQGRDTPLWTYPVNILESVSYTGAALQAGQVYTLRAAHAQFETTTYQEVQFEVLGILEQVEIALDLADLQTEMQTAGRSPEEIALARADYFWARGLGADAWAEVAAIQQISPDAQAAIAAAYGRICGFPEPEPVSE